MAGLIAANEPTLELTPADSAPHGVGYAMVCFAPQERESYGVR